MAKVAILGHGVVGSGTVNVIENKAEQLKKLTGEDIEVKYILVRHGYAVDYTDKFVYDFKTICEDEEISVVAEAIGGMHPAYDYAKARLSAGKSVVTSNKELVARRGQELMSIARENGVNFLFEGAVGGAIPIVHNMRNCLQANKVLSFSGILNGTTNYILTKMIEEGLSFDTALKQAQELGYAEADPSADVDGIDTCRKTCILADIVTGCHIPIEKVHTEGIRDVRIKDVEILKTISGQIKLLGHFEYLPEGRVQVMVSPFAVFGQGTLRAARDVFNAVELETDNAGTMGFYGRGAGSLPTASAVVNDIVECVKAKSTIYAPWGEEKPDIIADYDKIPMDFYVNVRDSTDSITNIFPQAEIIWNNEEKAFIVRDIQEKELRVKLNSLTVNSILRILK